MNERLTVPQKLLLAALEARKRSATFTAEDLVVAAWRLYPDTFGLSGYADQYPDSNRVLTNIMGTKGMRGKGWLRKVGEKQYRLSSAGLTDGAALLEKNGTGAGTGQSDYLRAELDRSALTALDRLVSTSAARKIISESEEAQLTFHDACGFWDITARSNANTLSAKLADATVLLERALKILGTKEGPAGLKLPSGNITYNDLRRLFDMHEEMQAMFKTELDVIRRRTDERLERRVRILNRGFPFGSNRDSL